jgi:hypothetical protein
VIGETLGGASSVLFSSVEMSPTLRQLTFLTMLWIETCGVARAVFLGTCHSKLVRPPLPHFLLPKPLRGRTHSGFELELNEFEPFFDLPWYVDPRNYTSGTLE